MVKRFTTNSVRSWEEDSFIFHILKQMNLAKSIFIFLIITTKHGYSKPTKRSQSKIVIKCIKSVWDIIDEMINLRNSYGSSYHLRNIALPKFSQFPKVDNSIIEVATILQYRNRIGDYGLALVSFEDKDLSINQKLKKLKIDIENNVIRRLNDIIHKLTRAKEPATARFNKSEIEKESKEYFEEPSSSIQIKIVYSIIVEFVKNLLICYLIFQYSFLISRVTVNQ